MEGVDPVAIERVADAAWPAAEQVTLGSWRLRATQGVTRRANSVFTANDAALPDDELEERIAEAELFYAARSLPTVFQISAATRNATLDRLLASRGYALNGVSEVWVRKTDAIAPAANEWKVERTAEPCAGWFNAAFDEPLEKRRVHEQIVRRAPSPRVFVSTIVDGVAAGCGMAVSSAGYTGIFCMATLPEHRRRGIGIALVHDLCAWAAERGDHHVFLQVMRENEAAKRLYRKAGFAWAYGYHYRVQGAT